MAGLRRHPPPDTLDYISPEAEANGIYAFELHLIPGLLQTEAYARAVIRSGISLGPARNIDVLVAVRTQRQRLLSTPNPPQLRAIVSEAALRQQVGGPKIMREQLQHLLDVAEGDTVDLQVLPYAAGAHPGHNGSFTILEIEALVVVLVESLTTG